ELGIAPKADIHLLMKQAEAFAEGDPEAESLTGQSLRIAALAEPEPAAAPEAEGMDPVLADIFVKEMRGHVAVIHKFVADARGHGSHVVEEPLYRACHTLLGSARMAGFEPAMAVAGPLSEQLRRHFEAGSGLTDAGVEALAAAAAQIDAMANALTSGAEY